jgi:hypothetical protein
MFQSLSGSFDFLFIFFSSLPLSRSGSPIIYEALELALQ